MHGHPNFRHERESIDWARAVLEQADRYVILDTETTGVTNDDEVIQLGVIDPTGAVLLDHLIRPVRKKYIPRQATQIHGITMAMLQDRPLYNEIAGLLQSVVKGRTIVTYNADFDRRLLTQTAGFSGGFVPPTSAWQCAMLQYAQFVGEWDDYRNKYRWHKLQGGDHTAVGDCQATLARIREMAEAKRRKYSHEVDVVADQVVEGQATSPSPPRFPREPRSERRSVSFGISISLDGGVELIGAKEPTILDQDAELHGDYLKALREYEASSGITVASMADIVRFVASKYREMTSEQLDGATLHSGQVRIMGIPYIVGRAIKCYREIKKMESCTVSKLLQIAGNLETYIGHIAYGLPHGNQKVRAEAKAIQEIVHESAKNELFFRMQVIWSDMWDKSRGKIETIQKKSDRKKAMSEFIKELKDLCDARSFRGLKDERERFIEYVKAQCDCG